MKRIVFWPMVAVLVVSAVHTLPAQQEAAAVKDASNTVPKLVNYSGVLSSASGKPLSGVVGVTFLLYKDQDGGAPLWMETQNVTPDKGGHYTVTLGSTSNGLPDVFISGEARWLAVQITSEEEQPRILLVAVPYALKAGDAETIGGFPPSAFVLASTLATAPAVSSATSSSPAFAAPLAASAVTTTGGTVNALPLFTSATNIQNSVITQTGSGSTAKIGINTATPVARLDINGGASVRGTLTLPATGTATAAGGKNSQPQDFVASSFSNGAAVAQTFQWQSEPSANDTATPSATLNLLFGSGPSAPAETGLKLSSGGLFTFATGQTFPGTGSGSVKSVGLRAPASDFTTSGSPVTTSGTLALGWTVAPASTNTANAIVKRDASGNFSGGTVGAKVVNAGSVDVSSVISVKSNSSAPLFVTTPATPGTAITGIATSLTGAGWGVNGVTYGASSNSYGVWGGAYTSSSSSQNPIGVYGDSPAGIGSYGQTAGARSNTGTSLSTFMLALGLPTLPGVGMWGDASGNGGFGVVGSADAGYAGVFANSSSSVTLLSINEDAQGALFEAFNSGTGGRCMIDSAGNLSCSGTKNAVVPLDGGKRQVAMSAIESPQNWFEDFGSAQLVNGAAVVSLDPDFIQTVNTEKGYKVFPVPNGDCRGLYVTRKTAASFEVHELGGGTSNVSFDYRITALRKKYETVRFADHTKEFEARKRAAAESKK